MQTRPIVNRLRVGAAALLVAALMPVGGAAAPAQAATADPTTTSRVATGDPAVAAVELSGMRFASGAARFVVLSRDDEFADSLAGASLTGIAPLLYTETDRLLAVTAQELERVLPQGETVYVLGGPSAVSDEVVAEVRRMGFLVERLAGETRIETALRVADLVRVSNPTDTVLLARARGVADSPASGWVDAVSAGAFAARTRTPVLLTPTDRLHPAVAEWLAARGIRRTILLGGTAALSGAVEAAVPGPDRIAGPDRTATAAEVARSLWNVDGDGPRRFVVVDGTLESSWTFGLAAAGLAAEDRAPVLLSWHGVTDATKALVSTCGTPEVDLTVVGDGGRVSGAVRERLDDLDGSACGPNRSLQENPRLQQVASCPALLDYLRLHGEERVGPYGLYGFGPMAVDVIAPEPRTDGGDDASSDSPETAPTTDADAGSSGDAVSGTNTQEAGVDEPDLVKTDGSIAVVVSSPTVRILDVASSEPRVLATVDLGEEAYADEVLLRGDRLLVMGTAYGYAVPESNTSEDAAYAPQWEEPRTVLTLVDVSDPTAPTVLDQRTVTGTYRSARMIDGIARVVMVSPPRLRGFTYPADGSRESIQAAEANNQDVVATAPVEDWLPETWTSDPETATPLLGCDQIYPPPTFSGFDITSVVTLDLHGDTLQPLDGAGVIAGSETVYASRDRLIVSTSRWGDGFRPIVEDATTELHTFDITRSDAIGYVASGAVPGFLLNQFALSERAGVIRVATTTGVPWLPEEGGGTQSSITTLEEQAGALAPIGRVDGLGKGERIFAVRFLGDLAAVVTFRRIDPLYMVDLADPANPTVLGELKIPGYSAYLHRIDEDHLVGVGQDADEDGRALGAQVSLFDVSDLSQPTRTAQVTWPEGYSEVEYDHRAFLHWPATTDMVLPLQQYRRSSDGSDQSFSGAVVVDVATGAGTDADALSEEARIVNQVSSSCCQSEPEPLPVVGGSSDSSSGTETITYDEPIRRSFVIGGRLFTVSYGALTVTSLEDYSTLARLQFEG